MIAIHSPLPTKRAVFASNVGAADPPSSAIKRRTCLDGVMRKDLRPREVGLGATFATARHHRSMRVGEQQRPNVDEQQELAPSRSRRRLGRGC
jgi:hypothetical protein